MVRSRRVLLGGAVAAAAPVAVGDYALFLLATVAVLGIYAASYDLLFGYAGMLSLGHAVFFGAGAYGVAHTLSDGLAGVAASLGVGVLVAAGLAVPLGAVAVRVSSHAFVLMTLLFVLVAELVARSYPGLTGGSDGMLVTAPTVAVPGVGAVPLYDPVARYLLTLAALVAVLVALGRLVETRFGLALRMVRENPDRAEALGYDVARLRHLAFGASAAIAGLAGGLQVLVHEHVSAGAFSIPTTADPVVFTLLGGRATVVGGVVGAALVRGLGELLAGASHLEPLVVGAVIVIVVVARPDGLLGALDAARDRWGDGG